MSEQADMRPASSFAILRRLLMDHGRRYGVAYAAALAAEVATVEWHRYPDRAATELRTRIGELHGVGPEQVFDR